MRSACVAVSLVAMLLGCGGREGAVDQTAVSDAATSDRGSGSGGSSGSSSGTSSGGTDSGSDSDATTSDSGSGSDAAGCTPGTQQCSGGDSVQTCGANGQWGTAWPCATGACSSGGCSGSTATGLSCAPGGAGMTNCGTGSESCCTSHEVVGGTYSRTYTNLGSGPTGTADPATVSGFRLDDFEVTVGRFRQFASAWNGGIGWLPSAGSGKHAHLNGGQGLANSGSAGTYEPGWVASDDSNIEATDEGVSCNAAYQTWTNTASTQENLPINCVNWWEAYAFCIWDGGFLPSESEWEYVAAGGSQQLEYPWGSAETGTACPGAGCQYAIYNCDYPSGSGQCTGVVNIAPVGTPPSGTGLWGQQDLAGNVAEWSLDRYATYVDPCADCAYLAADSYRVTRGGAFGFDFAGYASYLRPPNRLDQPPTLRNYDLGFRCARTP
jgi:formylglycine-generating enzyme